MIKTATFMGVKYHITTYAIEGVCVIPNEPLYIYITEGIKPGRRTFEVCAHEAMHACFPYMGEKDVTKAAKKIANRLWLCSYRLLKYRRHWRYATMSLLVDLEIKRTFPYMEDRKVRRAAKDISRFLCRLGYQRKI